MREMRSAVSQSISEQVRHGIMATLTASAAADAAAGAIMAAIGTDGSTAAAAERTCRMGQRWVWGVLVSLGMSLISSSAS